ncbi:MAG: HAD family hydrolase [Deltaproteobacteria bacterium]|nr:HAD family hydrolase [Deltaproteobacteria bacterium]
MRKLLIFDFDGVVVDSLDVYEGTVRSCLEKIGQHFIKTRADFLALYEDNFYASLAKRGVNLDAFMAAAVDILAQVNYGDMKPYPGLNPVLAKLQAGNILVIVSSSGSEDIHLILRLHQLQDYFQDVLGSDVHFSKKEKILQVLAKYAIDKDNTYYIGDTTGDIKEAQAVGIKTIAVTWGWHSREILAASRPDHLIDRPEELLALE